MIDLLKHLLVSLFELLTKFIGRPTKTMSIGTTEIGEDMFMDFLREVSPRFT